MKELRHSEVRTVHRQAEVERQASHTGEDWIAGTGRVMEVLLSNIENIRNERYEHTVTNW
jgi:hypothetical protein